MTAALVEPLIARLRAELANVEGVDGAPVSLMLSRDNAKNLLRILEFVESARIETMRGER